MAKLVAFTGGLDSTWIMHNLLNHTTRWEAEMVSPAYFSMCNGGNANFVEIIMSVIITKRILDLRGWDGQLVRWYGLGEKHFDPVVYGRMSNNWTPLIQQGSVVNGLARLMCDLTRRQHGSMAFVGWNKTDALEIGGEFGDWSVSDYARLKNLYSELLYFQDHAGKVTPLMTPAWDNKKVDMWNSLPPSVQELIQVASSHEYRFYHEKDKKLLWIWVDENTGKLNRYYSQGIYPKVAWSVELNRGFHELMFSELGSLVSKLGLTVPNKVIRKKFGNVRDMFFLSENTPLPIVTAYTATEWAILKEHVVVEEDKDLDSPDGKVESGGETAANDTEHDGEVGDKVPGTGLGLPDDVPAVGQGAGS